MVSIIRLDNNIRGQLEYIPTLTKINKLNCPFNKIIYADYIGSGKPVPIINRYLEKYIFPYYANVHSNSLFSSYMNNLINKTKQYIRQVLNVTETQQLIFTGNGATGAINHLVNSIDYEKYNNIFIFLSTYEHHSNFLPWVELSKKNNKIYINIIPLTNDGLINYAWYKKTYLSLLTYNSNSLFITSVTACSNVSGIKTNLLLLKKIIGNTGMLFVDYACSAPYEKINASLFNAIFISPHKFIGGDSTPGLLIADKNLFMNKCPFMPGGGCVKQANNEIIEYVIDIEKRETAGTPNIIGIIKIKLILKLKELCFSIIKYNEAKITYYIHNKLYNLQQPNLKCLYLNKHLNIRLPILCFSIDSIEPKQIVQILNKYYGIQARSGIFCSGLFSKHINDTIQINGWCRISFHWMMTIDDINYIINAIIEIANNHNNLI